jgi:hypothetical protein
MKNESNTTNYYDYRAIPNDYYNVIDTCIKWCRDQFVNDYENILRLVAYKKSLVDIMRDLRVLGFSDGAYEQLTPVVITLHHCIHAQLKEVCDTYDILQGHLAYERENKVFQKIATYTLNAITVACSGKSS